MSVEMNNDYGFFAMLDRMQYIMRWSLMRNSRIENNKEHSFDVAVIAQCLALIHNKKFMNDIEVDPHRVASYALYHDCTEIITGDLPTPIKYKNEAIKNAYKEVERDAAHNLASMLPEFLKDDYLELLCPAKESNEDVLIARLVKAADRIAAYIKCLREENSGNNEFSSAKETIKASIDNIDLPEVKYFVDVFVPTFGMNLDQLNRSGNN